MPRTEWGWARIRGQRAWPAEYAGPLQTAARRYISHSVRPALVLRRRTGTKFRRREHRTLIGRAPGPNSSLQVRIFPAFLRARECPNRLYKPRPPPETRNPE